VRAAIDVAVAPTWTDLMVWAVLAGSERLSRVLWAKSHEPLRAAIICSQLCRRLAALPHLRGDEEQLEHFADMCALARSEVDGPSWRGRHIGPSSANQTVHREARGRHPRRHIVAALEHHTIPYHTIPYHTIPYHIIIMHPAGTKTGRSGCSTR